MKYSFPTFSPAAARFSCAAALLMLFIPSTIVPAQAKNADEAACDRLAAAPFDSDKPSDVEGVAQIPPQNVPAAVRSCEKAASTPGAHRRMWLQLGRALEFAGRSNQARAAYEKAAAAGFVEAAYQLGLMAQDGDSEPKDDAAAKAWFEKAAAHDHPDALYSLGMLAAEGRAGPKDENAAKGYFERAAALGSEDAAAALQRLKCPFALKDKDGKPAGSICFDGAK